jgi:hypothetical protein
MFTRPRSVRLRSLYSGLSHITLMATIRIRMTIPLILPETPIFFAIIPFYRSWFFINIRIAGYENEIT